MLKMSESQSGNLMLIKTPQEIVRNYHVNHGKRQLAFKLISEHSVLSKFGPKLVQHQIESGGLFIKLSESD